MSPGCCTANGGTANRFGVAAANGFWPAAANRIFGARGGQVMHPAGHGGDTTPRTNFDKPFSGMFSKSNCFFTTRVSSAQFWPFRRHLQTLVRTQNAKHVKQTRVQVNLQSPISPHTERTHTIHEHRMDARCHALLSSEQIMQPAPSSVYMLW